MSAPDSIGDRRRSVRTSVVDLDWLPSCRLAPTYDLEGGPSPLGAGPRADRVSDAGGFLHEKCRGVKVPGEVDVLGIEFRRCAVPVGSLGCGPPGSVGIGSHGEVIASRREM